MRTTYLYTKLTLVLTMIALALACSSHEDDTTLPKPEPPVTPAPEPDSPLIISNGVVTGIADGYTEAIFPASVKRIAKDAFKSNKQIQKLTLNEGLEVIEEDAFIFSTIAEINFPSTLKEIGPYAFYNCAALTTADLSRTKVTDLPEGAFGISGLQSANLPSTLINIGAQAFLNTTKLANLTIPVRVQKVGNEAFRESGLITVLLPNNLSFMEQRVFYLCPNLQEVKTHGEIINDAPDGKMQESCFEGCPEISVFEIPLNMRNIGQGQLAQNKKLKSIIIPANISYIAFSAFNNTGIEYVTVEPTIPPTVQLVGGTAWYGFPDTVVSITVPTGTADAYKMAEGWKTFADKIKEQ